MVEEIAGGEIGLVAGADDMTECETLRPAAVVKGEAHATTLRYDADAALAGDEAFLARLHTTWGIGRSIKN